MNSNPSAKPYKRVLFKLSGEALKGNENFKEVHDQEVINRFAEEIKEVFTSGIQVCLVIGGGNIYRGASSTKAIERVSGDYIGMLSTVINALVMQAALDKIGIPSRVLSAVSMPTICEPYIRRRAIRHLEKHRVVIFAAGTGNPFFTTDTAATLRAIEMGCDIILKGTKVDAVYSSDPNKNSDAVPYKRISYEEVIKKNLRVMDITAIALAKESNIPVIVFSINNKGNFFKVLKGIGNYTVISN